MSASSIHISKEHLQPDKRPACQHVSVVLCHASSGHAGFKGKADANSSAGVQPDSISGQDAAGGHIRPYPCPSISCHQQLLSRTRCALTVCTLCTLSGCRLASACTSSHGHVSANTDHGQLSDDLPMCSNSSRLHGHMYEHQQLDMQQLHHQTKQLSWAGCVMPAIHCAV